MWQEGKVQKLERKIYRTNEKRRKYIREENVKAKRRKLFLQHPGMHSCEYAPIPSSFSYSYYSLSSSFVSFFVFFFVFCFYFSPLLQLSSSLLFFISFFFSFFSVFRSIFTNFLPFFNIYSFEFPFDLPSCRPF